MENITVSNVSKIFNRDHYQQIIAIKGINLSVEKGEIVCILGRSGCGKSTFLNILAGLIPQTSGSISIFGKDISKAKSDITYIQQTPYLLPYRNVFTNAALGLELRNELSDGNLDKLENLLSFLGFDGFFNSYPAELSGGMRQRLALARTLSINAPIILCDEPFSSLDFDTRLEIENFFWNEIKQKERTSLFITHHIDSAVALADRVVIFTPRPAKVSEIITMSDEFKSMMPKQRRDREEFATYYSSIWKALQNAGNNDEQI